MVWYKILNSFFRAIIDINGGIRGIITCTCMRFKRVAPSTNFMTLLLARLCWEFIRWCIGLVIKTQSYWRDVWRSQVAMHRNFHCSIWVTFSLFLFVAFYIACLLYAARGQNTVDTRLPSNLRPTTRECVHLVRRGHFRPRDKDGSHTIRSAIANKPILRENSMALCFIKLDLLPMEVLHCKNDLFAPVTLTLTRWPSYTNLTRIPWRYTECKNMNFLRQGFRKKIIVRQQTDTTEIIYHAASRVVAKAT